MGQSITSIRAHGPEQCRFRAFALHLLRSAAGEAARVAIAVLMPFHSITTTDSVESIHNGLAESPSDVLSLPSSSPKDAGGRMQSCRCVSRPLPTYAPRAASAARRQRRHDAAYGVYAGLPSSHTHLYRAVRLSHERVGQSITSIRAHGPEKCRFCGLASCFVRPLPIGVAIDVLPHRGGSLQYAFVGR